MKLRPYQLEAVNSTLEAFGGGNRSALVVMPTGCVAGATIIGVNRAGKGYSRSIGREFSAQFDPRRKQGVETMVRSHVGDRIGLHKASAIIESGIQLTCKLSLQNGKELRATPDHKILTDCGWCALGDLKEGQKVVCECDPVTGRVRKAKPYYRMVQGLRYHPYAMGVKNKTRNGRKPEGRLFRVPTHRLVAEAAKNDIDVDTLVSICRYDEFAARMLVFIDPLIYAVHHIDGDHLNNSLDNLEVLTHAEHHAKHGATDKLCNLGKGLIESSPVKRVQVWATEPTFDIICEDPHRNFVANGIVVHNCGKTVVFSHVADRFLSRGRVMVLAHREELIRQAAHKIELITGEAPEIEMAGEYADQGGIFETKAPVVVSSIQTQQNRMKRFKPDEFSLIITDEAHHATAPSYRKVFKHYLSNPQCKHLGVTATPDRADEEALGQVFDVVAMNYEILDAVKDGWLVRVIAKQVHIQDLDFSEVRTVAGDLNQGQLDELMKAEGPLHGVADATIREAGDRKTLVFCVTVAHAEMLAEILNRHKSDCARFICGTTPKDVRARTLRDYTDGEFQFLCNVGVFTEGFDEPGIECIVMARPTKSRSLYSQMAGRGTRPLPGIVDGLGSDKERREAIARSAKPHVEIIDFVGNSGQHKLVSASDILGGKHTDEIIERAKAKQNGTAVDVIDAMDEAAHEIRAEHEEKRRVEMERRRKLMARAVYETVVVDPFDALGIEPERDYGWDKQKKPSSAMVRWLRNRGVGTDRLNSRQAAQMITEIKRREQEGLCGYVQAMRLTQAGLDPNVSPREAAIALRELAMKRRQEVEA